MPVLIAMIDDPCAEADNVRDQLNAEKQEVVDDIKAQGEMLKRGNWPSYRRPKDRFFRYDTPNLDALVADFDDLAAGISASLFDSWRPYPARKPPLDEPVSGLPDRAQPLPAELEGGLP